MVRIEPQRTIIGRLTARQHQKIPLQGVSKLARFMQNPLLLSGSFVQAH
jgi:hypothetical protein